MTSTRIAPPSRAAARCSRSRCSPCALAAARRPPAPSPRRRKAPRAHASATYLTGVGDEQPAMFTSPLWQQLHTKIVRYIAPYDAANHADDVDRAQLWIAQAEASHQQILVAFYHSEHTPTKLPSVSSYQKAVAKFVKAFPKVRQYQSWNEANRGNVSGVLLEPLGRRLGALLPGAEARLQGLHRDRPRRARRQHDRRRRCATSRNSSAKSAPAHGHAVDLGPAQLLRPQPPAKLAHARTQHGARRPGVADRDRRDRAVRPRSRTRTARASRAPRRSSSTCSTSPPRTRASSGCTSTTGSGGNSHTRFDAGLMNAPRPAASGLRRGLQAAARPRSARSRRRGTSGQLGR